MNNWIQNKKSTATFIKIIRPPVLLLFVLLLSQQLYGQASFNVVDVKVEGNKTARESLILSVAAISPGMQLTASTTQDAITRLYRLGFFDDIVILAEEVTGGLALTIKVSELPKLGVLKFESNKAIKTKNLVEKINLTENNYLSPNLIFEKKNEIIDLYGQKGYFFVKVDHELKFNEDSSRADLTYKIKEGSKVKVEKVVLTGNSSVPAKDIIGKMRNRKRGFLKSSDFDKEKFPEDKDKIIEFLHNKGYIDAYLKSDSMVIDTSRNRMTIYLDIHEGPRYYFGNTDFTGNEIIDGEVLSSALKYDTGKPFSSEDFDESLYEIYFLYQERGYLHIRVIDDKKTRDSLIDITFDIVEGLPSEVNLVKIVGNTKTKEKVIRREMKIRPGQVFHRSLLIRSIRDVMALNYFGNVTPDILDLPSGDVDVVVEVEEKPTAQISAGAGYSGRDKFVGTFGLGIPNFRGMGQYLAANVDIGSRTNSYKLSFTEPWAFSTPTLVGGDIYYTNRQWFSDYTEGRRGGSIRIGRRLRWPDNYFRLYLRYRLEDDWFYDFSDSYHINSSYLAKNRLDYTIIDSTAILDPITGDTIGYNEEEREIKGVQIRSIGEPLPGSLERFNEDWFSSSSFQVSIVRDSRDLPEFSTRGSILSYTYETTGGLLGGYWKYQTHLLSYSKFVPVFWKIALAGKITFGALTAPPGDTTILAFDRFSPGGTGFTGIVRGYDDGSLTPDSLITIPDTVYWYSQPPEGTGEDPTYDSVTVVPRSQSYIQVRGKYMLVGNFELQLPIAENQLYALAFFDMGNSWLYKSDIKLSDLYRGVGIGFRLVVPGIGTIGFDFGYALDDRRGQQKGWKPHFQIGTTFR